MTDAQKLQESYRNFAKEVDREREEDMLETLKNMKNNGDLFSSILSELIQSERCRTWFHVICVGAKEKISFICGRCLQ